MSGDGLAESLAVELFDIVGRLEEDGLIERHSDRGGLAPYTAHPSRRAASGESPGARIGAVDLPSRKRLGSISFTTRYATLSCPLDGA
jgi:hypothetical protein